MRHFLETAIEAVRSASQLCSRIQSQLVDQDTLIKKDRSPVTIADFASQALICRTLHEQFPSVPIVGEEDARNLREDANRGVLEKIIRFFPGWTPDEILDSVDLGNRDADGLFWTLDPIDGTKGFLRGEQYAVALALIREGKILIGVLGCPNLPFPGKNTPGTLFYAMDNHGSYMTTLHNGEHEPVHVSEHSYPDVIRFLESVESGHANHDMQSRLMQSFRAQSVRMDSQSKYGILARGDAEVYLRLLNPAKPDYREKIWDHAAGVIIVKEAGGKVTDALGAGLDFSIGKTLMNNRGVIVSNNRFHDTLIEHIRKGMEAGS